MQKPAEPADNVTVAILLVCGFAVLIPFVEGSVKALGEGGVAAPQITWARFMFQVVVAGGFMLVVGRGRIEVPRPIWPFLARGFFITVGSGFLYAGLAFMPIADSSAIFFVQPLFVTALSALVLHEKVGWRRWTAVAAGFAGALLIAGPNFASVGWPAVLPLLAALSFTFSVMITRSFRGHGSSIMFLFTTAATATVLLTLALAFGHVAGIKALAPVWPTFDELKLLLVVGTVASVTNLMLTQAFRTAPSSVIAPFLYLEIVGAMIMGFVAFGDVPKATMLLGGAIVVGSGLVVWWRESVRQVPPSPREK